MVIISCPHCAYPVDSKARYCANCGVDLALAALAAEQAVMAPSAAPDEGPLAPEILVPRIGDYLIERGMLQAEGIQRALDYQQEQAAAGRRLLLGQALLDLHLVDRETLDQVITEQILQLQAALNTANRQLEQRVKERTQELQNALERLSELNQLKSNFIANISHELRTPLTHIKGYLDILGVGGLGDLTPEQAEAIQVIQRAEGRLERLIDDLIQYSLASRGELRMDMQDGVQFERLIRICVDAVDGRARAKRVGLAVQVDEDLPPVRVDVDKISWALSQLLDNAVKFTGEGGEVAVDAAARNGTLTIAVSDTGIGIPEDRLKEIFEPFHQLDGSATRRYGGTGLGLAMVRRIMEAHGAQVSVQSAVGRGSRFEFSLPVNNPPPAN